MSTELLYQSGESRRWLLVVCVLVSSVSIKLFAQQDPTFPFNQEKMTYAQDMEAKALATGDSATMAEAFYLYGKVYAKAGDYRSSQRYFLSSLQLLEALEDSSGIARALTRLSENEALQDHFPEAMQYARTAVAIAEWLGSPKRLGPAYRALGLVFQEMWESEQTRSGFLYDSSLFYFQKVYDLAARQNDPAGISDALISIGILKLLNNERAAIEVLKEAVELKKKHRQLFSGVIAGAYLATAYLKFGDLKHGKSWLQETEKYYHANAVNDYEVGLLILTGWKEYFQKSGNLDKALEYSERIRQMEKEQFLADRTRTIERLDKELKADRTENELLLEQQRASLLAKGYQLQQTINLILLVIVVATVLIGFFYFRLYKTKRRLSIQNDRLVGEQSHRIKNHLQMAANLLSLQSYEIRDEQALQVIQKSQLRISAIALLQQRLYSSELREMGGLVDFAKFGEELVALVLNACGYSTIEKTMHFEKLVISAEEALSLSLILNELITNSCKYAFPGHPAPVLSVGCYRQRAKVFLVVSDNGIGVSPAAFEKKSSFGLQLIDIQARQLRAAYRYELDAQTGGTTFTMTYPETA